MRAILLVWVGLFLLGASGIVIPKEQHLKYKKYLKLVNKPAVKSIKTKYGDIFDCVDIYKQHAFDNPLLKNLTIPSTHIPFQNWNRSLSSLQGQKLAKMRAILDGGCPEGSVPIRRIRMQDVLRAPSLYLEGKKYVGNVTYQGDSIYPQDDNRADHHYAVVQLRNGQYFGTKGDLSLWNPQPVSRELFSLSQFWVSAGPDATLNTIESGWMVFAGLFNDQKTRLFTFWTGNGYRGPRCYNTLCPGYVHTNPLIPLGLAFEQVSQVDGPYLSQTLQAAQEPRSGDWLFLWEEDDVVLGYLPRRLLPILGYGPATRIDWGGETYNPLHSLPLPAMGSGHFPREGPTKCSHITRIKVVDTNRHLVDIPLDTVTYTDKPGCYNVDDPRVNYGGQVGRAICYGGPGGMC